MKKSLRTAYGMYRGKFSLEDSLVRLNEQEKDFPYSVRTAKPSLILTFNIKTYRSGRKVWKLGNIAWVILPSFSGGGGDIRSRASFRPIKNISWIIISIIKIIFNCILYSWALLKVPKSYSAWNKSIKVISPQWLHLSTLPPLPFQGKKRE